MKLYIYQQDEWPHFNWDSSVLLSLLGKARNMQGKLMGKMDSLGIELRREANLETLTSDILNSFEIEGEILNPEQVRSSLARRLGMNIPNLIRSDMYIDGIADMIYDVTQQFEMPLTNERLFDWYSFLLPTANSYLNENITHSWRNDSKGPMKISSGKKVNERVSYQAPDAVTLNDEMNLFVEWFNNEDKLDPIIKAGIAYLWFVIIYPFDSNNGKIARSLTDMLLSKSEKSLQRFYSMSAQIALKQNEYYSILEKTRLGNLDITAWLQWFINCLINAFAAAEQTLARVLYKQEFWNNLTTIYLNPRQNFLLNKIQVGLDNKLTSAKWAEIARCSADTALRDIKDLLHKQVLKKGTAGGRSTNYKLNDLI